MSKFIQIDYTFPSSTGTVLINIEEIVSIDCNDGTVYIKAIGSKFAYPVNHSMEEIRKMIDKTGIEIVAPEKEDPKESLELVDCTEDAGGEI